MQINIKQEVELSYYFNGKWLMENVIIAV